MMTQTQNHKGGVKTEAGKEITKYNAISHGVLKQVLLPDEIKNAESLKDQFVSEYQPKTLTEELLIETMVTAYIRRERATNAEREYFMEILNPAVYEEKVLSAPLLSDDLVGDAVSGLRKMTLVRPAHYARITSDKVDTIDRTYARYINTCERQFFRALHELQRVQAVRKGFKPTSVAVDVMGEKQNED